MSYFRYENKELDNKLGELIVCTIITMIFSSIFVLIKVLIKN